MEVEISHHKKFVQSWLNGKRNGLFILVSGSNDKICLGWCFSYTQGSFGFQSYSESLEYTSSTTKSELEDFLLKPITKNWDFSEQLITLAEKVIYLSRSFIWRPQLSTFSYFPTSKSSFSAYLMLGMRFNIVTTTVLMEMIETVFKKEVDMESIQVKTRGD